MAVDVLFVPVECVFKEKDGRNREQIVSSTGRALLLQKIIFSPIWQPDAICETQIATHSQERGHRGNDDKNIDRCEIKIAMITSSKSCDYKWSSVF